MATFFLDTSDTGFRFRFLPILTQRGVHCLPIARPFSTSQIWLSGLSGEARNSQMLSLLLLLGCCAASVPSLDGVDMEAWERQLELEYSQLRQRFHSEWRKTKGSELQALQPTSREHKWYLCTIIRTLLHWLLVADAGYFTLK